ncbi:NfeD family protein [Halalkalicoccus subterraneus]|uniref:NfeD family protein n=1 Tax=Halalkalicoccus subterraneus TaxID=2675002 RepID=UPI000EFC8F06|nr:NfeD family protein [Halalkalicoccus subterraneus]
MVEILGASLPLVLLVVGVLLTIAEALAPGAHLIVLGVALLVAGLVGLALGPFIAGGALAIALALTVLLVGGVALFAYRELDIYGGKGTGRTSDSASLKGRTGRVTERVSPTGGQIKLTGGGFNPYYTARSMEGEIEAGEEVFVIDPGGGNVLTVESMGVVEDEIDRELDLGRVADGPGTTEGEREAEYER